MDASTASWIAWRARGANLITLDLSGAFNSSWSPPMYSFAIWRTMLIKYHLLLRWTGALCISKSPVFWYLFIYLRAACPGLDLRFLCYFLTPVVTGADLRSTFWDARDFFSPLTFYVAFDAAFDRGILKLNL